MGGGVFSPALVLGALTGLAFGMIATWVLPNLSGGTTIYALAGMGAVAAAVLGAPISTALILFEMTGDYQTGIAVMVETATDNTNRTVANVRMHFSRCGGTLGNSGSVAFLFEHKCVFKFHVPAGTDFEELELSMIDLGVDEFAPEDETTVTVEAPYESFGAIQKWLDDQNYEIVSGESIRIATDTKELHGEEREAVEKLIERLEEDDDVVNVYTAMKDEAEEE